MKRWAPTESGLFVSKQRSYWVSGTRLWDPDLGTNQRNIIHSFSTLVKHKPDIRMLRCMHQIWFSVYRTGKVARETWYGDSLVTIIVPPSGFWRLFFGLLGCLSTNGWKSDYLSKNWLWLRRAAKRVSQHPQLMDTASSSPLRTIDLQSHLRVWFMSWLKKHYSSTSPYA